MPSTAIHRAFSATEPTTSTSATATTILGASYPADMSWRSVTSDTDDPAALTQYRILPVTVNTRFRTHIKETKEALLIELQYRHGTLKRQMILKHRFRGAASLEKKGRNEVAINYLATDDPAQREITEHIYFPSSLDAMSFHMYLTEFL